MASLNGKWPLEPASRWPISTGCFSKNGNIARERIYHLKEKIVSARVEGVNSVGGASQAGNHAGGPRTYGDYSTLLYASKETNNETLQSSLWFDSHYLKIIHLIIIDIVILYDAMPETV